MCYVEQFCDRSNYAASLHYNGMQIIGTGLYTYPVVQSHCRTREGVRPRQQEVAMIRLQLPQVEAERLEQVFQSAKDRKLRDRLQIVLMAHRGRPRQDIAADLGIHRRSVTRWLNAYCEGGLDHLRPRKAKGNTAKIPASLADDIRRWVID